MDSAPRAGTPRRVYSSDSSMVWGCQSTAFRLAPTVTVICLSYCIRVPPFWSYRIRARSLSTGQSPQGRSAG